MGPLLGRTVSFEVTSKRLQKAFCIPRSALRMSFFDMVALSTLDNALEEMIETLVALVCCVVKLQLWLVLFQDVGPPPSVFASEE